MSYDIYIGNAEIEWHAPDKYGRGLARLRVNGTTHPDAPVFPNDQMTGNGNSRHPGYSAWTQFTRDTGLHDLFFGKEDGLMVSHPGIVQLIEQDVVTVEEALRKYKTKNPNAVPGFEGFPMDLKKDTVPAGCDACLARLEWLAFWMRWAIENCERPAIFNS